MSAWALTAAHARELGNGLRRDRRRQAVMLFALGVNLALGWGAASRLTHALTTWEAAEGGATERGLALLSAAFVLAVAAIGWMTYREQAFGDRARLLLPLPLSGASRALALVGQCVLQLFVGFGLTLGAAWFALGRALGWKALPWIAVQAAGAGVALWLVLGVQMGWRALRGWERLRLIAVLGAGPAGVGALYERAFRRQEEGAAHAQPRRLLRALTRPLRAWRGPAGALLVREVLVRGRSRLEWFRALLFAAALLLLFPRLVPLLAAHGLPGALGVVAAVAGTLLFLVFDGASSPFGAEGSRLLHLLTAPLSRWAILRAKVAALFLPLGVAGGVGVWALGARTGLPLQDLLWAEGATALVLFGMALVFALGSAWDADLELEIEAGLRGLVQETAPTTTVRMALFALASLVAAGQVGILVRLGPGLGLVGLALSDVVLLCVLLLPSERALLALGRR